MEFFAGDSQAFVFGDEVVAHEVVVFEFEFVLGRFIGWRIVDARAGRFWHGMAGFWQGPGSVWHGVGNFWQLLARCWQVGKLLRRRRGRVFGKILEIFETLEELKPVVHLAFPGGIGVDVFRDEGADLFVAGDEFFGPRDHFGWGGVGWDGNAAAANFLGKPLMIVERTRDWGLVWRRIRIFGRFGFVVRDVHRFSLVVAAGSDATSAMAD